MTPSLDKHRSLLSLRGVALMLLTAMSCFYLLEGFSQKPWTVPFGMQLFNAAFFLVYFTFWLGVSGRSGTAVLISCLTALMVGYANHAVIVLRGNPILPWDLLSLKTGLSVSGQYQLPWSSRNWLLLAAATLLCCLAFMARLRLRGRRTRLLVSLVCLIFLFSGGAVLQNERFTQRFHFNETLFTPGYMYQQNGFIPSFLMNLRYLQVSEPEQYSQNQLATLAHEIDALMEDNSSEAPSALIEKPNILAIMNETFSDPAVLSELVTNEDYMPFFRSLTENTVRGDLYVSVIGGNTATTEFEFLTGDSMAFLPPGSVAYQQFIHDKQPSLPMMLKELGYKTTAMHPYAPGGWDRDEVYDFFDFDEALFIKDFTHKKYIRKYISDQSVYREIIGAYEKKEAGQPLFVFAVTMQNHGGYGGTFSNFKPEIKVEQSLANATYLEHYLSLIQESDRALEELIDYFKAAAEPTVILFFGDHQPHDPVVAGLIAENSYGLDDQTLQQRRYQVPYLIWANYAIKTIADHTTSTNFLAALLMQQTGLDLSPYHYFLADLANEIPVMTASFFMDKAGNRLSYDAADETQSALLKDYESLQFNHLFDPANRLNALFEPMHIAH